jgi:uncharacterized protein (DUF697 family)
MDSIDATIRARLEQAAEDKDGTTGDMDSKAQKAIWAAVALSAGMGVVPFGINLAWFFAVATGLIVYLGELYGYTYTKREAAALLGQLFKSCGWTWSAYMFGMKFMAEALKGAGIITMGGATPVGMALDATLSGSITYAVGFTTLKYLEQNSELSPAEMRREFRARIEEGKDRVQELVRQRSAELGTEARSRYETAARQLKESNDRVRDLVRQRGAELGTEARSRYETAARQLKRG